MLRTKVNESVCAVNDPAKVSVLFDPPSGQWNVLPDEISDTKPVDLRNETLVVVRGLAGSQRRYNGRSAMVCAWIGKRQAYK